MGGVDKFRPVKGIHRCNTARSQRGWRALVYYKKKRYSRYFADDVNGGSAGAFLRAVEWAKRQHETIGKPWIRDAFVTPDTYFFCQHEGVLCARAQWSDRNGVPHSARASVHKNGKERAIEIVLEKRRQGLAAKFAGRAVSRQLVEKELKRIIPMPLTDQRKHKRR